MLEEDGKRVKRVKISLYTSKKLKAAFEKYVRDQTRLNKKIGLGPLTQSKLGARILSAHLVKRGYLKDDIEDE